MKKTTEEFIADARKVHGDKYDYSKVKYDGHRKPVCIICPIHGEFYQTPESHLAPRGCRKCGVEKNSKNHILTNEQFISRAKVVHGDRYDYSEVQYIKSIIKVKIKCNKCGSCFWQTPNAHLRGANCPICENHYMDLEMFKERAAKVHNNKYIYDKTVYLSANKKVIITCPIHGDFLQTPRSHTSGAGCPACGKDLNVASKRYTTEGFIEAARRVHGDKYDYSRVQYNKNGYNKVLIGCSKHGYFLQQPNAHLAGCGCPKCKRSIGEDKIALYLERKGIKYKDQYMIHNEDLFCKNRRIYVDFYIPDMNLFIEYNGSQHYKREKYFEEKRPFEDQESRDIALKTYCKQHGIGLIEIPYTKLKNIDEFLDKALKGNGYVKKI